MKAIFTNLSRKIADDILGQIGWKPGGHFHAALRGQTQDTTREFMRNYCVFIVGADDVERIAEEMGYKLSKNQVTDFLEDLEMAGDTIPEQRIRIALKMMMEA